MTQPATRIAQHPREVAACVSACLQDGDIEGIISLFHPDCQIFFPPDQPPKTGPDGVRAAFEDLLAARPKVVSDIVSEVITGDTALLRANWRAITPDGAVLAQGQSTEVLKKLENGGWGYLIDCPLGPPSLSD